MKLTHGQTTSKWGWWPLAGQAYRTAEVGDGVGDGERGADALAAPGHVLSQQQLREPFFHHVRLWRKSVGPHGQILNITAETELLRNFPKRKVKRKFAAYVPEARCFSVALSSPPRSATGLSSVPTTVLVTSADTHVLMATGCHSTAGGE
jgi:hypothetical protein